MEEIDPEFSLLPSLFTPREESYTADGVKLYLASALNM